MIGGQTGRNMGWPASVELQYIQPDPDLADYVSVFYDARIDRPVIREQERATRAQFRFTLLGEGEYTFADGTRCTIDRAGIVGPTSGPTSVEARGPARVCGFGLQPLGWVTLMGPGSAGMTDRAVDAAALLGDWVGDVWAKAAQSDSAGAFAVMQEFARELLHGADPGALWFIRQCDAWLSNSANPAVPDLVASTGMSARSVERLARRYYGHTPKMLARKYRALRVAAAVARGERADDLAIDDAFYDQSHLIREMKQFAGYTPGQVVPHSSLDAATARRRHELKGNVSRLVSDT